MGDKLKQADGTLGEVRYVNTIQEARTMYNLEVEEAHTFFVGTQGWLVHNGGQTDYYDGLGYYAAKYRIDNEVFDPTRNIAVVKIKGRNDPLVFPNTKGGNHSEMNMKIELRRMGIDPNDVLEIYSERSPCNYNGCNAMIKRDFPQAKVSYTAPYDIGSTKAEQKMSRDAGNAMMEKLMEELSGGCKL